MFQRWFWIMPEHASNQLSFPHEIGILKARGFLPFGILRRDGRKQSINAARSLPSPARTPSSHSVRKSGDKSAVISVALVTTRRPFPGYQRPTRRECNCPRFDW